MWMGMNTRINLQMPGAQVMHSIPVGIYTEHLRRHLTLWFFTLNLR